MKQLYEENLTSANHKKPFISQTNKEIFHQKIHNQIKITNTQTYPQNIIPYYTAVKLREPKALHLLSPYLPTIEVQLEPINMSKKKFSL